jgi:hypothetical protein
VSARGGRSPRLAWRVLDRDAIATAQDAGCACPGRHGKPTRPGSVLVYDLTQMDAPDRLPAALAAIDAANAEDPNRVLGEDGQPIASELLYGQRMSRWLDRLYPDAPEPLKLAARAQHVRRWEVPRDRYPMDRAGYHRWRTGLYTFHADTAAGLLRAVGYDEPIVERVRFLIRKERLKADPDTQALEDTICLVFLENYFAEFSAKHDADKVVTILRRTWAKMSPVGREAALRLDLSPAAAALVGRALSPDAAQPRDDGNAAG